MTLSPDDQTLIDSVFRVRVSNNMPWKRLVEIALTHAPDEARAALREISVNDQEITRLVQKLAR